MACPVVFNHSLFLQRRRQVRRVIKKCRRDAGFFAVCAYEIAAEQKARTTYDNLLRLIDNPDVREPLKFLRAREIVHFQRFGDALRVVQDHLDSKNYYAFNPAIDLRKSARKTAASAETDTATASD